MREQSYYEIALTNRQVMTIFVVLLFCLVVAFLSGVWIGREGSVLPVETVAAQETTAAVAPDETQLEELHFFSRPESGAAGKGPSDGGGPTGESPSETAAEEYQKPIIIEESSPALANETDAPAAVGESEPKVTAQLKAPAPSGSAAGDTAETATIREEEAPAPSAGGTAGEPGGLVVQVFSSTDRDQALQVLQRLRDGGYPAVLSPVEVGGAEMHRVRLGPYTGRAEAQSVADQVRRAFKLDTWITR